MANNPDILSALNELIDKVGLISTPNIVTSLNNIYSSTQLIGSWLDSIEGRLAALEAFLPSAPTNAGLTNISSRLSSDNNDNLYDLLRLATISPAPSDIPYLWYLNYLQQLDALVEAAESCGLDIKTLPITTDETIELEFVGTDTEKCLMAKRLVGLAKMLSDVYVGSLPKVKALIDAGLEIDLAAAAIVAISNPALAAFMAVGGGIIKLNLILDEAFEGVSLTSFIFDNAITDIAEILGDSDNLEDLVCDIYSAANSAAAYTNIYATIDALTAYDQYARFIIKKLFAAGVVAVGFNRYEFLKKFVVIGGDPADYVPGVDCATCGGTGISPGFDCSPARSSQMLAGTPDPFAGDDIPDSTTYTSTQWAAFSNAHYVAMKLHGWYNATLSNLSITPGKTIIITGLDCNDNICWQSDYLDAGDMPYVCDDHFAYLVIGVGVSTDPQFSISISFSPSETGSDCS